MTVFTGEKENKKVFLIIACIILVQCLLLFYWQSNRGNFYNDELYSFSSASGFISNTKYYINEDPIWEYGKWMSADELVGRMKVDENESILSLPLHEQIRLLIRNRTYMGLLNILMSKTGYEATLYQYAWNAVYLNLVFLIIAEILMAYCIKRLTGSNMITILSVIMFGFSGVIMCLCEYVRFYMLAIMMLLAFICCHLKMWKEKDIVRFLCFEMIALASGYFALRHSELMLVTCGSFTCFFFISLLARKEYKKALTYAIPLIFAMYRYVYLKTNLLDIVMHPEAYADPGKSGAPVIAYYFLTCTPERAHVCFQNIIKIFCEKWFGNGLVMAAFITLLIICKVYSIKYKNAEKTAKDANFGFIIIILLTALASLVFNLLTNLNTERYNSFIIVLLMIAFWYCVHRMSAVFDKKRFFIFVSVLTIASAVISQRPDSFSYLYVDEKPVRDIIENYTDKDRIIFPGGDDGFYNHYFEMHTAYESLISAGNNTRVLAVDPGKAASLKKIKHIPDEFLAWHIDTGGTDEMMKALSKINCDVTLIGTTHKSEIYYCRKK